MNPTSGTAKMKSASFEHVRKDLSEITNEVKYKGENYILTKNNKPFVGIVPVDMIYLLKELFIESQKNKSLSKIMNHYAITISEKDVEFLTHLEKEPGKLNNKIQKAISAAKQKIENL